jgi:hypothetical protein
MSHTKTRIAMTLLCGAFLQAGQAFAQAHANQALIELPVKKGVLTAEDFATLSREVAAQASPATPPAGPASLTPQ